MGHIQNFTDTIWIVGPLGQAIKTPTSFSEYAESRPSTKIVSFQVFLGKPSKCEKNFLVIESYVTRCMTNFKTSGLILDIIFGKSIQ